MNAMSSKHKSTMVYNSVCTKICSLAGIEKVGYPRGCQIHQRKDLTDDYYTRKHAH